MKKLLLLACLVLSIMTLSAQEVAKITNDIQPVTTDTIKGNIIAPVDSALVTSAAAAELAVDTVPPKKMNFFQKFIKYFSDANKPKDRKKFDLSFIGGPSYSVECGFQIGVLGAAQYYLPGTENVQQPSQMALSLSVGTVGYYSVAFRTNNFFADDNYRLNGDLNFYSFPSKFWGIGYDDGKKTENETKMKYLSFNANVEFLRKLHTNLYAGLNANFNYSSIQDMACDSLLYGQPYKVPNFGLGLRLFYDSRDVVTCAHEGVYLSLTQMFNPRFLGNGDYNFISTLTDFRYYQKVWKGGVLAFQVIGNFKYGNPTWASLVQYGGSDMGRGYYEGRFRDKYMVAGQMEVRQHVWKRLGIVLFGGAGSVFHDSASFKKWLPMGGIGLRWEFKKFMNIRLDFGIGAFKSSAFVFNMNESF